MLIIVTVPLTLFLSYLLWLPPLTVFTVKLCEFYFYRIIGKLTDFLQLQELNQWHITITSSVSDTLLSTPISRENTQPLLFVWMCGITFVFWPFVMKHNTTDGMCNKSTIRVYQKNQWNSKIILNTQHVPLRQNAKESKLIWLLRQFIRENRCLMVNIQEKQTNEVIIQTVCSVHC